METASTGFVATSRAVRARTTVRRAASPLAGWSTEPALRFPRGRCAGQPSRRGRGPARRATWPRRARGRRSFVRATGLRFRRSPAAPRSGLRLEQARAATSRRAAPDRAARVLPMDLRFRRSRAGPRSGLRLAQLRAAIWRRAAVARAARVLQMDLRWAASSVGPRLGCVISERPAVAVGRRVRVTRGRRQRRSVERRPRFVTSRRSATARSAVRSMWSPPARWSAVRL